jgi:hypothetical protein
MIWIRRNAIALVALFVALGGTGYAALRLPAASVGTRQLRDGAVTDGKVRAHSLTPRVFAAGALAQQRQLHTTVVTSPVAPAGCPTAPACGTEPAGTTATTKVLCPAGTQILGGGYQLIPELPAGSATVTESELIPGGDGWQVTVTLTRTATPPYAAVRAVCGS